MKLSDFPVPEGMAHIPCTKKCADAIEKAVARHYPAPEREAVLAAVKAKYRKLLSDWPVDLGGEKNFHNGVGGSYDCFALMSYYAVCRDKTSLAEIEELEGGLFLPTFRKLRFVDCSKPFWRHLMYKAFKNAERQCARWGDYVMRVAPYEPGKPIYYEFTRCPAADFARAHGLLEVMPALCNPDYTSMELIGARLVRCNTCANGEKCDYTICGKDDGCLELHPEYRDEAGYRRNK